MFDLLVLQCKTEIYKFRFLKQPWYAIVLLLLLIAASLGMFVSSFIFQNAACTLICCGIMLLLTLFVAYLHHPRNKQANPIAELYQAQTIGPLEALLKSHPYRLYHTAGLDWLISCCDQHIQPPQKPAPTSVLPYIFSIFTLAYGLVLKEMTTDDVVLTTMSLLALLLVWEIANRTVVAAWVDWYRNPNKLLYQRLKSDLEYIRVQRQTANNPQHRPPNQGPSKSQPKGPNKGQSKPQSKGANKGQNKNQSRK